jgi:hypothetical protein
MTLIATSRDDIEEYLFTGPNTTQFKSDHCSEENRVNACSKSPKITIRTMLALAITNILKHETTHGVPLTAGPTGIGMWNHHGIQVSQLFSLKFNKTQPIKPG